MTTLEMNLDEKQKVLDGKVTQVKGVVQEQLGNLQNDELTRLAGKKDQVVGQLQANYGRSWVLQHSKLVLAGTAVAVLATILTLFLKRTRHTSTQS